MKILMLSSEVHPYAKVGGLGDVVPHLSRELARRGHEVKVLMPRYYNINRDLFDQHPAPLSVHLGDREIWTGLYHGYIPDSEAEIFFLEHEELYGRDAVYVDDKNNDFPDNLQRFSLLCRAAFNFCRLLNWYPDIVHGHDWATALVSTYLKSLENRGPFLSCAAVFTIHNIGYQGIFPMDQLGVTGIAAQEMHSLGLEYHQKISTLKSALVCSDAITTVSPNYSREILSPELGFGMDGVLRERKELLEGILNGMDYQIWNPEMDQHIPYPYAADSLENKALNKNYIQQESGLEISSRPAMIGIVSRLVGQKGFALLCGPEGQTLRRICEEFDIQLVILGTGETWIEDSIRRISAECPNIKAYIRYNETMSHVIQAGSDFFLMPSLYEPCGLTQMYALRYGTIPIVSPTGGLSDTVSDIGRAPFLEGTGIVIDSAMDEDALLESIRRAMDLYQNHRKAFAEIRQRGMKEHFGWEEAAEGYEQVYKKALKLRKSETLA